MGKRSAENVSALFSGVEDSIVGFGRTDVESVFDQEEVGEEIQRDRFTSDDFQREASSLSALESGLRSAREASLSKVIENKRTRWISARSIIGDVTSIE